MTKEAPTMRLFLAATSNAWGAPLVHATSDRDQTLCGKRAMVYSNVPMRPGLAVDCVACQLVLSPPAAPFPEPKP